MQGIFLLILPLWCSLVLAQGAKDRMFHTLGFAAFTDYQIGPNTALAYPCSSYSYTTNTYNTTSCIETNQASSLAFMTIIYRMRYNLVEPTNEFAVAGSVSPAFGISVVTSNSQEGFGSFSLPLAVSAEFGAGSTYNSTSNIGGFVAVGPELMLLPMFGANDHSTNEPALKKTYIQTSIEVGIRYWNKNNRLREFAFKYGMGQNDSDLLPTDDYNTVRDPRSYRLSWSFILNY